MAEGPLRPEHRAELGRMVRFGIVGLLSVGLYMLLFMAAARFVPPVPASLIAYLLSMLVNFVLQSRVSFRQRALSGTSAVRFVLMHLFCMALNSSLLWLLTGPLALPVLPAQAAIVGLVAALSYLISRAWVYPADAP
jgi:putative flippase GtrA